MPRVKSHFKRDVILVSVFCLFCLALFYLPTGFEPQQQTSDSLRCEGRIVEADNTDLQKVGIITVGHQALKVKLLDGPFQDQVLEADNTLVGRMDLDKIYREGDSTLVVLTLDGDGNIKFANAQDHYRIGLELTLLVLFAVLLVGFGGWTGLKALLSFLFTGLMIWKVLVPLLLKSYDPILISLGVVSLLTAAIIFLVAGLTKRGLVAFLGAFLGILTSAVLAYYFTNEFRVHAAVMPFAETLLYAGYAHLNLTEIFSAAVFIAASGAVMDLAMDVSASLDEVVSKKPDIRTLEAVRSGFSVGRSVVGTMTTTLLLAYSGGYITLLMAFMAKGIPLTNMVNLLYVSAEILKTLVGSFGLVLVAPFTAIIGALVYTKGSARVPHAAASPSEPALSRQNSAKLPISASM